LRWSVVVRLVRILEKRSADVILHSPPPRKASKRNVVFGGTGTESRTSQIGKATNQRRPSTLDKPRTFDSQGKQRQDRCRERQ
jgi:hypothetical protein